MQSSSRGMEDLIGESLAGYRLEALIGCGAMGSVFLGRSERGTAAIKVLELDDPLGEAHRRFRREISLHRSLDHPHIAKVFDAGHTRRYGFLVLEYLDGASLDDTIKTLAPLPLEHALSLGIQIIDALVYLHERHVAHRDLKPSNVMVSDDGTLKLLDFGLAVDDIHTRITTADAFLGTLRYTAPEVAAGISLPEEPADIHAVGLILFELLTRRRPFEALRPVEWLAQICSAQAPRLGSFIPRVPESVETLIANLLAKDPADRPAASVVRDRLVDLARVLAHEGASISSQWSAISVRTSGSVPRFHDDGADGDEAGADDDPRLAPSGFPAMLLVGEPAPGAPRGLPTRTRGTDPGSGQVSGTFVTARADTQRNSSRVLSDDRGRPGTVSVAPTARTQVVTALIGVVLCVGFVTMVMLAVLHGGNQGEEKTGRTQVESARFE